MIPLAQERSSGEWINKLSRSQIDTQATKAHKKHTGKRRAIRLFCVKFVIGFAQKVTSAEKISHAKAQRRKALPRF